MADVSVLGYSTLMDIVSNYSSTDAGARFVMPKRVLDRMTPLVRMLPLKASNNILSNIATRTDSLPVAQNRQLQPRASRPPLRRTSPSTIPSPCSRTTRKWIWPCGSCRTTRTRGAPIRT